MMRSCAPEEILAAFSDAQSFSVPNEFFDSLPTNTDVWSSFYLWMIDTRRVRSDRIRSLPDRTFVGDKLARRLRVAEKRRITRCAHLHGKELERALSWSDVNTGPRTEFAGRKIRGDLVIVLSDDTEAINAVRSKWRWEGYNKQLTKVKKRASGSNFYEWLASSCDRNDPIGDFARDTMEDAEFPRDADHFLDVQKYLGYQDSFEACSSPAAEAWIEYAEKYPERIKKRVLCDECGDEICDLNGGLIASTGWGNFFDIVHINCRDESTRWQIH